MGGVYVHVPFCGSKCRYCDFYSVRAGAVAGEAYVDAIAKELAARRGEIPGPFDTVYIGGGTPSTLPAEALRRMIRLLVGESREGAEVTVEVNPDDITPALSEMLVEAGVNRVSMGIQSFDDAELRAIGRRHDAATAIAAVGMLRSAGIGNISCDLIYGLPGQTAESFRRSIDSMIALAPQHISAYLLSYEPGTWLTRELQAGRIRQATDDEAEAYYNLLCRSLSDAGYEHYEISNFARPGMASRHNSSYWDPSIPYLGLGPAAHSYDGHRRRRANVSSIGRYLASPADAADPDLCEELTPAELLEERIMLGLRTAAGLYLTALAPSDAEIILRRARQSLAAGHILRPEPQRLVIAEGSWLIADALIAELI